MASRNGNFREHVCPYFLQTELSDVMSGLLLPNFGPYLHVYTLIKAPTMYEQASIAYSGLGLSPWTARSQSL